MSKRREAREAQARQLRLRAIPGGGNPGKIAVREGEDEDIGRILRQIDRLDGLVERSCLCAQKVHAVGF